MMCLPNQQRAFKDSIIDSEAVTDLFRPGKNGTAPLLHIYRQAYTGRLLEALRDNYPVLHQVLGDEGFEALALDYIAHYPSTHPSIRWFGHQMERFLQEYTQHLPHPAILDLAKMEWAVRTTFDAANAPLLRVEELTALPAEAWLDLRCQAHPTVNLLELEWEVEPVWKTLTEITEGALQELQAPPPEPRPHTLLIWRNHLDTRWRSLEPLESQLLAALINQEPFSMLCEQAAASMDAMEAATTVAGLLRRWIKEGLLTRMTIKACIDENSDGMDTATTNPLF